MGNGSGISRGDRNRNARLARLRALVSLENAIVGIDPADEKQMVVVCDHDSRVLTRRTFECRAWDLAKALDWAAGRAAAKGWAGVTRVRSASLIEADVPVRTRRVVRGGMTQSICARIAAACSVRSFE